MNRSRMSGCAAMLGIAVLWAQPGLTRADDWLLEPGHFQGPLRWRDPSPFGFLRLDLRPAFASTPPAGTWTVESTLAYQNTWALTKRVEDYLQTLDGRRELSPAEVDAIRALPGENYLVDLETTQLEFIVHRQFTPRWGVYAVLGGIRYGGAGLDGAIEQFHRGVGATDYGRESLPRGGTHLVLDLKSSSTADAASVPSGGVLDPTVGVRYTGIALPTPWSLVLEGAVKVPVAGERPWLSTGRTDVGIQGSVLRQGLRHAFFGSLALVQYAGAEEPLESGSRLLPTLVCGLESRLTNRTNSVLQLYASPSIYTRRETDLAELRADRFLLSVGLRHQRGRQVFSAAVTENVGNTRNTPDLGLQFGWTVRPR